MAHDGRVHQARGLEAVLAARHVDGVGPEQRVGAALRGDAQLQRDEAVRSASLAAMTLMLAAEGMGLASAPMGGFDAAGVASAFGLQADELPVMLVAVGRAAEVAAPKPRRPVAEVLALA